MRQGPVSQATRFGSAQFIKPGPVRKLRVHTARTLAANSCCTFLMGGPGRCPRKIKGRDRGKFMSQRLPTSM